MTALIRSEFRKIVTTRSAYLLLAGMVGVAAMAVLTTSNSAAAQAEGVFWRHPFVFIFATIERLFALVFGIRAMTDEFRYGTIVPSLLLNPERRKLLAAKTVVIAVVALVFTTIAEAVMVGLAFPTMDAKGFELSLEASDVRALVGLALGGMLWAVLGVGIGAVVEHQVAPIVGSLIWLMGLEQVVRVRLDDLGRYLPGEAGLTLGVPPTLRAFWVSAATLAGYAVVALIAGSLVMNRRDIT